MSSYQLISGRTLAQASGMHSGKLSQAYQRAVYVACMNAGDMAREGFSPGQEVLVSSACGESRCLLESSDIPFGLLFIPMGPAANALTDTETDGTGMPLFKGFTVEVRDAT